MIIGFLLMRYKETKGQLPFVKPKVIGTDIEHVRDSSQSSVLRNSKEAQKPVEAVQVLPSRNVSE